MISFVVTARNDNYGGDFLERTQAFVNVLLTLCERYSLEMELVMVEWNPPPENHRLAMALKWPESPRHCRVRIIEVPEDLHRKLPHSEKKPMFEYIAKNVGVRRALGEYIIVTNPDILYSEELIKFLASWQLSPQQTYRSMRYDVQGPVPISESVDELLEYCRRHVIRRNDYLYSHYYNTSKAANIKNIIKGVIGDIIWRTKYFPYRRPFTNASGDFFMMHRSHWHHLLGYPQIIGADIHGLFHTDSFMMYEALFHGLKEVDLPNQLRIYHQEHDRPTNTDIYSPEIAAIRARLLKGRKPIKFNDESWGLGDYKLNETIVLQPSISVQTK
jgi:hypothetical protein